MPYGCFRDHNSLEAFPSGSRGEVGFRQVLDESDLVEISDLVEHAFPDHECIRNVIGQVTARGAVGLFGRKPGDACQGVPTYTAAPNVFGGSQVVHYRSL